MALAKILVKQRIVEPRLTGGSAYASCQQEMKPATIVALPHCPPVPQKELVQLLRRLERFPKTRGGEAAGVTAEVLRDQAMVYLMTRTDSFMPRAVTNLEEAIRHRPRDATLYSDLAAARIVLAGTLGEPYELVRSLDASERALSLAPGLAAAWFNRALALEKLFLANQARAAWQRYREIDSASPWSREAEEHVRSLPRRAWDEEWKQRRAELEAAALRADQSRIDALVDAYRQPARESAQEEWLPAWADAWTQGQKEEAERLLRIARAVGEALTRKGGDAMVQDAVAAIETADDKSRSLLAEGHRAYREGRALYMRMRFNQSEPLLSQASQAFRRGGSPVAGWADLFVAVCVHFRSDYDLTLQLLEDLRRQPRLERYPALKGRILYNLGIIRTVRADFSGGLAAYIRALSLCVRTGEIENLAAVRHVLAENLSLLGQTAEAWKQRYLALSALDRIPSSMRRTSLLFEATEACLQEGHPAFALALQSEAIPSVERWGGGVSLPQALLKRSRIALSLGRTADAERDVDEAQRHTETTADQDVKEALRAEILTLRSRLLASRDPRRAGAELTEALQFYEKVGARLSLITARQELARLHLDLGDLAAAESNLRTGIEEYEAQRAGLAQDSERISFFEQSRVLFDEMIALQARLGRNEDALSYAERSRARALLDQVTVLPSSLMDSARLLATESPTFPAAELRRLLPTPVAVVQYHWIGDRLFTWVITTDGIAFHEAAIDRSELAKSIDRFLGVLKQRGRDETVRAQAEHLFDMLLASVQPYFKGRQRLVFVPDGLLFGLPFAALIERGRSRYLVEDYELVVAPSATVYLRCSERGRQLGRAGQGKILAVGNPTVADTLLPVGGSLPAAETEAVRVAGLYPRSVLLTAGEATASRFLNLLDESEVVHFAGHAHVNEAYPLLSALLFAPEIGQEGTGPLFAHQIYGRHLQRTRVVVLAACSTGRGSPRFAEEAIGLARPFLAAGVPAVVASLSEVEDAATLQLLTTFHRHFLESHDPVAALRKAQREQIESTGAKDMPPWSWASFEVFGGDGSPH
ncbi:MAG TPA: CHAT domain-containing protein [Thermoanaerobaculia bacterium]|nr:CHAT domain-containing protein [Thermoanaerobaculia bacterium]